MACPQCIFYTGIGSGDYKYFTRDEFIRVMRRNFYEPGRASWSLTAWVRFAGAKMTPGWR